MKMIMTVIPKFSGEAVLDALISAGYYATISETKGGMLRQSQLTLFIAVDDAAVSEVLEIIKTNCKSHSYVQSTQKSEQQKLSESTGFELGGAVTFVWQLDQLEKC